MNAVQFLRDMPVTNRSCCGNSRVMCERCAAAALTANHGNPPVVHSAPADGELVVNCGSTPPPTNNGAGERVMDREMVVNYFLFPPNEMGEPAGPDKPDDLLPWLRPIPTMPSRFGLVANALDANAAVDPNDHLEIPTLDYAALARERQSESRR